MRSWIIEKNFPQKWVSLYEENEAGSAGDGKINLGATSGLNAGQQ
jgi:hypothetical protein